MGNGGRQLVWALAGILAVVGAGVTAVTTAEAAACEIVVLAVPWDDVVSVLTHLPPWQQQILIDATNPFHGRAGTFTGVSHLLHGFSSRLCVFVTNLLILFG